MDSDLEQRLESQEKKKKMSSGSKILLTGGTLAGIAYMSGRRMKSWFYPPSLKKYAAIGAMFMFFLGMRNSSSISREIGGFYQGVKRVYARRLDRTEAFESLKNKVQELTDYNGDLEYQNKEREKALRESKAYITSLEQECFNASTAMRASKIKVNPPPKEAFLNYLLHDKGYNSIIYKIDKAVEKPRGGD